MLIFFWPLCWRVLFAILRYAGRFVANKKLQRARRARGDRRPSPSARIRPSARGGGRPSERARQNSLHRASPRRTSQPLAGPRRGGALRRRKRRRRTGRSMQERRRGAARATTTATGTTTSWSASSLSRMLTSSSLPKPLTRTMRYSTTST